MRQGESLENHTLPQSGTEGRSLHYLGDIVHMSTTTTDSTRSGLQDPTRCPMCGSAITPRPYEVNGRAYLYFEICSGDGAHVTSEAAV